MVFKQQKEYEILCSPRYVLRNPPPPPILIIRIEPQGKLPLLLIQRLTSYVILLLPPSSSSAYGKRNPQTKQVKLIYYDQIDRKIDRSIYRLVELQIDRQIYREIDRQIDRIYRRISDLIQVRPDQLSRVSFRFDYLGGGARMLPLYALRDFSVFVTFPDYYRLFQ